ncbi:cytochrome P450/oxidoreductase [Amycolatopsis sacchari]|uniref:Cytochrome P450 n=1 Tax=Amycolatopsis sacchari TaxID=115433 RepID=A0A1I3R8T0_9PSEU|nr:cytochrome P450 [Amycolatopsis sacchari]SFJ42460.1 Cytochrome P450 [Amycolatopsis sacchari]
MSCPFTDPRALFGDLAAARARPGLTWSESLGRYVVSRYEDIVEALQRPEVFSSRPVVPELPSPWRDRFAGRVPDRGTLLGHDNPDHDRLRSAVNTFFMPRRLARFEPWIERTAHSLIDEFTDRGEIDLKRHFALPLPLRTIAHVVGLDTAKAGWIGFALAFFLGPKDTHYQASPEEKAEALLELHDHLREVMADRRRDRRDDLISHIWNVRDSGEVEMTDFEMLSMFPGLMLAGHETSSNLLCMGLAHLLSRDGAYEAAQYDHASRARALEELLRYESAITGMPRLVTRDTELGGTRLRAGEEVFLAYASGSRDAAVFDDPDGIVLDRGFERPHLGFGQGVHACLGAPLARLLLRTELRVIHERLPGLRLAKPYAEREYGPVGEARGVPELLVRWDPGRRRPPVRARQDIPAVVAAKSVVAEGVVEVEFTPLDGRFPAWAPGAHIDVRFAPGLIRQYSLCGDPGEHDRWRVAIRREVDGRGGSVHAHDRLAVGDEVTLAGPRNNFALVPAPEYLFVAGGIGITPLLPMMARAAAPWRTVYLGRTERSMPYRELVRSLGHATIWPSDRGRFDLDALLASAKPGTAVYCCGPERLLAAVEELCDRRALALHVERFAPKPQEPGDSTEFEVVLAASGRTVHVGAEEPVLDALNRAGAQVPSTCREGTCGTCEVRVLSGTPDHRDSVLTPAERAAGKYLMPCVSRSLTPSLVLDL